MRKRGHGGHDGITVLGDHIAVPGYAVGSRADQGRLGAALSEVKRCADKVAGIADPTEHQATDTRVRCGASACPGKNKRQPADVRFCAYCGRDLIARSAQPPRTQDADTAPTVGGQDGGPVRENRPRTNSEPKAKQKPVSPRDNGQAKRKQPGSKPEQAEWTVEERLEADRRGLARALLMAQGKDEKKR